VDVRVHTPTTEQEAWFREHVFTAATLMSEGDPNPLLRASIMRNARARGGRRVDLTAMRRAHREVPAPEFYAAIEQLQRSGEITLAARPR
jgi:hypothetical protein